ncbi:MAG: LPS export ABC transporter periplasmic protein LptC [Bacteroidota bacterium]
MIRTLQIAFLLLIVLLSACSRTEEEKARLKQFEEDGPVREAFNVRFLFSEQALLQAELTAPHAIESTEDEQDVRIFDDGLNLVFYTEEGTEKSNLTSENGKFRNQFKQAEVWGNVVMVNEKGDRMETEKLFWDKVEDRLYTPEFVKIRTESEIIFGDSMIANTDFTEYRIFNIRGAISLTEDEM